MNNLIKFPIYLSERHAAKIFKDNAGHELTKFLDSFSRYDPHYEFRGSIDEHGKVSCYLWYRMDQGFCQTAGTYHSFEKDMPELLEPMILRKKFEIVDEYFHEEEIKRIEARKKEIFKQLFGEL